jgi:murein DD-endopeptidase MepM/ murein hydrolase activator NlpD
VIQGWLSNATWNGKACVFPSGTKAPAYKPPSSRKKGDPCIHEGIDYARMVDNKNVAFGVVAAATGRAICVEDATSLAREKKNMGNKFFKVLGTNNYISEWGTYVIIKHGFDNKVFYTYYIHLEKGSCKSISGQLVERGSKIGVASDTGSAKGSGIHLHFELKDSNQKSIDPYGLYATYSAYPSATSTKKLTTPYYWIENPPREP